jgi:hypothetical protein
VKHHHTVPILTQVLAGRLLLLLPHLGCTTKQERVLFECLLHMLLQRHLGPFCFLESTQFLPRTLKDPGTVNQEAIIYLNELKFQVSLTQDKIMECVGVTRFQQSGLAGISLCCQNARFSRVPASGLKEFHCSPKRNMPLSGHCNK